MIKNLVKLYNVEKAKYNTTQAALKFVWELFRDSVKSGGIMPVIAEHGFEVSYTDIGEGQITKQYIYKGMKGSFIIELDGELTIYVRDFRKKDPNSYIVIQIPKEFEGQYKLFRADIVRSLMRG